MNQQKLPNAIAVLILGIISIVTCCYGIPGIILSIIGLVLYGKDKKLYDQNPTFYSNYDNLKTGRILCIIGLALGILSAIYFIALINYFGWETLSNPELMQEKLRELQQQ